MEKTNIIKLFVVIYDTSELLPHFLEYYTNIGVDQFVIGVVYNNENDFLLDNILEYTKNYNCIIKDFKLLFGNGSQKDEIEYVLRQENYVAEHGYLIHCDLDEFIEYPAPLQEIIKEMDNQNIWCISSKFLDRVASDGHLNKIYDNINLGEQFPLGTELTKNILLATDTKVILQRGLIHLDGSGHHNTKFGMLDRWPIGNKEDYIVHHFKWNQNTLNRMRQRIDQTSIGIGYNHEQQRFINYYTRFNNKIPIEDKLLNTKYIGKLKYFNN